MQRYDDVQGGEAARQVCQRAPTLTLPRAKGRHRGGNSGSSPCRCSSDGGRLGGGPNP